MNIATPNRQTPPHTFAPLDFDYRLMPLQSTQLDNGIPLYAIADLLQPVMQIELVFPAGLWHESRVGVAQATAALLKSGTSRLNSLQVNEAFEQYGASMRAGAGPDWASVSLSCLTRHLPEVLPLLTELLADTVFPQHELDLYIQNTRQRLSVNLRKGDFVANRLIDEYLFGYAHPYGRYTNLSDLDALDRPALQQHLKAHYHAGGCRIFLAGSFGPKETELINSILGSAQFPAGQKSADPAYALTPATTQKQRIINDEGSVQGAIRIASSFPEKNHPDFPPMIVLNTLFGGYFGSRLMSNIREDKGYTYGIHSFLYNNRHNGALMISTEAGRDVCEAAIAEIYREMEILRKEPVDKEELELVKNYLLGNLLGDLDGSFQNVQRWKNLILNGFTEERFHSNIATYKTLSAERMMELAQTYLRPERFFELVVY